MTAMERRVLVSHLVARAQDYMMLPENDSKRIGCFERTGCLITRMVCDRDALIKPQGVTDPFVIPVVPPQDMIDGTDDEPEPNGDLAGMQDITQLMSEIDIEDAELILSNKNETNEEEIVQHMEI